MKIRCIYSQGPTLKNIFSPSKLSNNILPSNHGHFKCKGTRCKLCSIAIVTDNILFENGKIYYINNYFDCNSKFSIYVLKCFKCSKLYIGETSDVRARMALHKSNTNLEQNRHLYVNKHFHSCSNGKFYFCVMYQSDDNVLKRKTIEDHFINKFEPSLNK